MENTISEAMRALPPGFRFHATDEELLIHYLKPKILGRPGERYYDMIPEIDICEFEPWQLPSMFCHRFNSKELFLFCRVKRKYSNSKRSDRTTEAGYWKVTGKERAITSEDTNEPIGIKKTLVFYTGRVPKGKRTNWVSHEYQLNPNYLGHNEDEMLPYVACRIKNKKEKKLMMGHAPTVSPEVYPSSPHAPTVSPEVYSSSPHAYTSNVSETPVNQEGDYSSFCNSPSDEVADNQEAVNAQPEMSVGDFMESLPSLHPLDDILSDCTPTPTYQAHAGTEEGWSSLFDFSYDSYGDELDYGYMKSPYSNFANYSNIDWAMSGDFYTTTREDELSRIKSDGDEWFFFSFLQNKYPQSKQARRTNDYGSRKPMGKPHKIRTQDRKNTLGLKKILVFKKRQSPKNAHTKWVLHEYSILNDQSDFVLYRLKKNPDENGKKNSKTQKTDTGISIVPQEGSRSSPNLSDEVNNISIPIMPQEGSRS
ncbi:hypothetical protein ACJRO7_000366 [Eucalyptus globulus]|uniref:NAC domain-containing protein n=1 Tax=Eucalyptus globulus TaxID=34317 RepID=A0ABD3LND8_EUCGL